MKYFLFTRKITKKEAINKFGKLGFTTHKEGVTIEAENLEEAYKKIEPFNYKKHIRFEFEREVEFDLYDKNLYGLEEIKDLGICTKTM